MPSFRYFSAIVDAESVAAAVVRRPNGYLRPDAVNELAELIAEDFDAFCSKAAPLRRNKHLFTPLGLSVLPRAIKATRGFVSADVALSYFNATEHLWSVDCDHVEFRASVKDCCASARRLDGLIVHRHDRFGLTLPDCDADYCPCRWVRAPGR